MNKRPWVGLVTRNPGREKLAADPAESTGRQPCRFEDSLHAVAGRNVHSL